MKVGIIGAVAVATVAIGLLLAPVVFAGRVLPGVSIGGFGAGGLNGSDVAGTLQRYEDELRGKQVTLRLRDQEVRRTLGEIGVELDKGATAERLLDARQPFGSWLVAVQPVLTVNAPDARRQLHSDFADILELPRNASLDVSPAGRIPFTSSEPGEQVDVVALQSELQDLAMNGFTETVDLVVISTEAPIQDSEVEPARALAETLLQTGFALKFAEEEYSIKPFTLRRLISFAEQVDPTNPDNTILGVELNVPELEAYLETTIRPEVDQEPINARFAIGEDGRASQFDLPQVGQQLNIEETTQHITQAVGRGETEAQLAVAVTEPEIRQAEDLEALGIEALLASGESNFAGSPANRVHNIRVGAEKYNGLLIAPAEEFSFNRFLGPVDAANGFKPELVIKQNVTVPEFGGGLCQVSTTIFRAAAYSGMEITNRRNHSYAVSYYGTPGFDATIYPPYTDFRFLNNTPGYVLIQTKIVGTNLIFEFWGTDDGRSVQVSGPNPYNRQPDGAVKATLTQRVTKDEEVLLEDTFYSNYKSPDLFPKAVAENEPGKPKPDEPTPTPAGATEANQDSASWRTETPA